MELIEFGSERDLNFRILNSAKLSRPAPDEFWRLGNLSGRARYDFN